MLNKLTRIVMIAGLVLCVTSAYAGAPIQAADALMEPAPDTKKKKAGAECKTSDECQRHHTCSKAGEKNVCTAPPRVEIPKT